MGFNTAKHKKEWPVAFIIEAHRTLPQAILNTLKTVQITGQKNKYLILYIKKENHSEIRRNCCGSRSGGNIRCIRILKIGA